MRGIKKNIEWIKNFGIKTDVFLIQSAASGQMFVKDAYGLPNCRDYKYIDGEEFRTKQYLDKINKIVAKEVKSWTKILVKELSRASDDFEVWCERKKKYSTTSQVIKEYKEHYKRSQYLLGICDTPFLVEEAIINAILKELRDKQVKNINEIFQQVTVYLKDSYINEEEKQILKIAIKAEKYGFKAVEKDIIMHYDRYCWMGYRLFSGNAYNLGYFKKRVKGNMNSAGKKLKRINAEQKINKMKFDQAIKKYNLDKWLLKCGQDLIWIRDKRYVGLTRGGYNKRSLFEKIAKILNLKTEDIYYFLPEELIAVLNKKSIINKKIISERRAGYAIVQNKGKISNVIVGKELNKLKQEEVIETSEIKGQTAYPGKIKGKVRLVINDEDLLKFRKGEILVSNMTTPDYVMAMKKAAAIITDLGGITCHAAIISRELNIPCVIGTKIATRVIKNGDLVEVDANKGVLKILKS